MGSCRISLSLITFSLLSYFHLFVLSSYKVLLKWTWNRTLGSVKRGSEFDISCRVTSVEKNSCKIQERACSPLELPFCPQSLSEKKLRLSTWDAKSIRSSKDNNGIRCQLAWIRDVTCWLSLVMALYPVKSLHNTKWCAAVQCEAWQLYRWRICVCVCVWVCVHIYVYITLWCFI